MAGTTLARSDPRAVNRPGNYYPPRNTPKLPSSSSFHMCPYLRLKYHRPGPKLYSVSRKFKITIFVRGQITNSYPVPDHQSTILRTNHAIILLAEFRSCFRFFPYLLLHLLTASASSCFQTTILTIAPSLDIRRILQGPALSAKKGEARILNSRKSCASLHCRVVACSIAATTFCSSTNQRRSN